MNSKFYQLLSWLLLASAIISCSEKKEEKSDLVEISFNAPSFKNAYLELNRFNMISFDPTSLDSITLDSLGKGSVKFNLSKPTFAILRIDENYFDIYLEGGYKLDATLKTDDDLLTIAYTGKGADTNNYLSGSSSIRQKFYAKNPTWWTKSRTEATEIFKNFKQNQDDYLAGYSDTASLEPDMKKTLQDKIITSLISLKQQYGLVNAQHTKESSSDSTSDYMKVNFEDIPANAKYLELGILEYAQTLDLYLRTEVHGKLGENMDIKHIDSLSKQNTIKSNEIIKDYTVPNNIKELLLAKNIMYWLGSDGITWSLDSIYNEYKKHYPNSDYTADIQEKYEEWVKISKGKPAPEITGITQANDTVSLNQLKGKVVYVDVWATWCRPCIAEFPHYKELQAQFEGNENVAFLFVSVDENQDQWRNYLQQEKLPDGIYVNEIPIAGQTGIMEAYNMWGIPRYILIDKDGKIASANTKRPSSGDVPQLIRELL
ncbi:TlpA family protein disulfide reductase [Fulvivirga ligni]|uniref:TlpA family protein disulfide reductase n=1 Tax=Fulvivirga ligni TaxID=2904246 RepID=UPI001F179F73|nr:TlpA disulfide reductase family protein [Fulvivirga ligni]UII21711.1 TlpA family protein disulfide reductase [Fulvivirga ligni]